LDKENHNQFMVVSFEREYDIIFYSIVVMKVKIWGAFVEGEI